jgi:short-subunit dehydrogenase
MKYALVTGASRKIGHKMAVKMANYMTGEVISINGGLYT